MNWVVFALAVMAGSAWLFAEARVEHLQRRLDEAQQLLSEAVAIEKGRRADDIVRRRRPSAEHWGSPVLDRLWQDIQHAPTDELAARRLKGAPCHAVSSSSSSPASSPGSSSAAERTPPSGMDTA